MVKLIKNFIVVLSISLAIALVAFTSIYGYLCIKANFQNLGKACQEIQVDLFNKINLNQDVATTTMPAIHTKLSNTTENYIGVALSLYNNYLYTSESVASTNFANFKTIKITNNALISMNKTKCQYLFTNNYSGHQLRVIFYPISKNQLIFFLQIITICCAIYLGILVVSLVMLIFIFNRKKSELELDMLVPQTSDFSFSHNCISKFEEYILDALNSSTPFSVVLIKNFDDIFDESIYADGFNLIKAHINLNHGYYEFDENRMIVLLPNTEIKQAINLIEEFFARLIEENINITINAGVTTLNKRHTTTMTLINEAELALKKASLESENIIFGFKPDPKLYVDFVTKKQLQSNSDAQIKIEDYQLNEELG